MIFPRKYPTVVGGLVLQHHLYFDTMDDFPNLPTLEKVAPGSDAYCLTTQQLFILSKLTGRWEPQFQVGGGGGGGGGNNFAIRFFTNDRTINETGIPVTVVNFSWDYANGIPESQAIVPGLGAVPISQRTAFLGGQNISADTTFTLNATDGLLPRVASTEVKFYHPVFWGVVANNTPTSAEIEVLNKHIGDFSPAQFTFNIANGHSCIASPVAFPITDIRDSVFGGSILNTYTAINNVPVTIADGSTVAYRVFVKTMTEDTSGFDMTLNIMF